MANKPEPINKVLYQTAKNYIYKKHPKHSAYRSGLVVKHYKKLFAKKYGKSKSPYKGKKPTIKGLSRWFKEDWKTQRGTYGYKYKSDVYRPTKRITKKSPKPFKELTKKQVEKARRKKAKYGRVNKFT